ncbi:MAG: hypothetical protein WCJ26_02210 [bacterium]
MNSNYCTFVRDTNATVNDLKEIVSSISHLKNDIKAEVIAAEIIENGLGASEIVVFPDGSFRRKFSKDVTGAEVIHSNNGQEVIGMHVSRDGLYDSLPEALFHGQSDQPLSSGHEMAKMSKLQKKEEKEARLFLLPFENEIFYHRIQIELEERKILYQFSENLFNDIYPQFWRLDRTLPEKLVSRFVLILHLAHKIIGKPDLTGKCLGIILEEEVNVTMTGKRQSKNNDPELKSQKSPGLGSTGLGVDFVCGGHSPNTEPVMEFVIGPLNNSGVEDYLENAPYARFLDCFYSFFVPVEMNAVTTVKVSEAQQLFTLNDTLSRVILGFNSGI